MTHSTCADAGVGISFVVPVRDGERWLEQSLAAILAQDDGRPFELLVVDDGSTDASPVIIRRLLGDPRVRQLAGEARGATAAINLGIRSAAHAVICQVDQDVIVQPGWLHNLLQELDDPDVAAAQGYYTTDPEAPVWARLAGYDLESRYARIEGRFIDHVCSGNTVYRAAALHQVGLFDESLGYGYDNDISYRLGKAGYRLAFCRGAHSIHRWREDLAGYLTQQYGQGYGRLDVVLAGEWFRAPAGNVLEGDWTAHTYAEPWLGRLAKVSTGDLDLDGDPDIVLTPSEESFRISWVEAPTDPVGGAWMEHVVQATADRVHSLAVADMDRDADLDLVVAEMHTSPDPDEVVVLFNPYPAMAATWDGQVVATTGSHNLVAGDMDHDADVDLADFRMLWALER